MNSFNKISIFSGIQGLFSDNVNMVYKSCRIYHILQSPCFATVFGHEGIGAGAGVDFPVVVVLYALRNFSRKVEVLQRNAFGGTTDGDVIFSGAGFAFYIVFVTASFFECYGWKSGCVRSHSFR